MKIKQTLATGIVSMLSLFAVCNLFASTGNVKNSEPIHEIAWAQNAKPYNFVALKKDDSSYFYCGKSNDNENFGHYIYRFDKATETFENINKSYISTMTNICVSPDQKRAYFMANNKLKEINPNDSANYVTDLNCEITDLGYCKSICCNNDNSLFVLFQNNDTLKIFQLIKNNNEFKPELFLSINEGSLVSQAQMISYGEELCVLVNYSHLDKIIIYTINDETREINTLILHENDITALEGLSYSYPFYYKGILFLNLWCYTNDGYVEPHLYEINLKDKTKQRIFHYGFCRFGENDNNLYSVAYNYNSKQSELLKFDKQDKFYTPSLITANGSSYKVPSMNNLTAIDNNIYCFQGKQYGSESVKLFSYNLTTNN